jgi:hypothetical protein
MSLAHEGTMNQNIVKADQTLLFVKLFSTINERDSLTKI